MRRALLTILLATAAAAQDDPFAAMHARLEQVAESSLARVSSPEPAPAVQVALPAPPPDVAPKALARVRALEPQLRAILAEEGMPEDLAAVVLVESGGVPTALSPKGARGLWQFMPETARRYGLQVSSDNDERLHVEKATRAAARYLRDLYGQFNDWELALASYNAGEGAVARAMARARATSFSAAARYLPEETRKYVPAVTHAMRLFAAAPQRSARLVYAGMSD